MANCFINLSCGYAFVGLLLATGNISVSACQCGTTEFTRGLISKGTETDRGEYPFLAAVYLVEEFSFICGGSLISAKHVLTAAHCVNQKHKRMKRIPDDVIVLLGAYDLTSRFEKGIVQREVSEIHIHPDWRVYSEKYDADLAILVLSENVSFTNYIRPVCIPSDDSVIIGAMGSVVGWGLTENGTQPHLKYPKQAIANALNESYCYTIDYNVAIISSQRTFCGRGEVGSPNRGDSGGGFFVRYGASWVQLGIISALRSNATGYVGADSIAVYTNVQMFKHWLIDTVTQSGGEVGEAIGFSKIKIQLNCLYDVTIDESLYGCFVDDVDIRSDNIEVASFTGSHQNGKTDEDVLLLQFRNGTMFYLPDGIGNNFKNLKIVYIQKSLNTQVIRRSNFKHLKSLVKLGIIKNDIESLEEDTLWDLPHLEIFTLTENKVTEIKEKTFVNNSKLRQIYLDDNQFESIPRNLFRKNLLLEKVRLNGNSLQVIEKVTFQYNFLLWNIDLSNNYLQTIDETIFINNSRLKEIYLFKNYIESIPSNLFQNNFLLELVRFDENNLKTIDKLTFVNNLKLKGIYLEENHIESIPGNLFQKNLLLEKVRLNGNSLQVIDEVTFQNNLLLWNIDLSNNYLKTIDETIFINNSRLKEIYLFGNQIEAIPRNLFQKNLRLEVVWLDGNNLKTIDEVTFVNNLRLNAVDLSDNYLESIPRNLFKNNLLLEIVRLNGNHLQVIDEVTFMKNPKLMKIYLYENQLESIPRNLFRKNVLLEKINFNKNFIKIIEVNFSVFKNLKYIHFYDNLCIDGYYQGTEDPIEYRHEFRNLTEFQKTINVNCSSVKS